MHPAAAPWDAVAGVYVDEPDLPLCCLVAHPWHAIRGTEAMRLRSVQGMRGIRPLAENPHGADAVIEVVK